MRILKKSIWPYQVNLKPKTGQQADRYYDPRIDWLEEKWSQDRWYVIAPNRFAFKTQEDATMFLLRWS